MKTKLHYLLTSRSFIPPACKVRLPFKIILDVGVSEILLWALPVTYCLSSIHSCQVLPSFVDGIRKT